MTLQIEEPEFCKLKIFYTAEPDKVKNKRKETINIFRKNAKIPGFRKGKASVEAVALKCKKQIEDTVKQEMLSEAYQDILFEGKIKPIGHPQIENVHLQDDLFNCNLTILKKPTIELNQYKGLEIPKPHQHQSVNDIVEAMIQELRIQNGEISPYGENDFVQSGDKLTMDVKYSIDDQEIKDVCKEGCLYLVGDNMFPNFDDNILGMKAGEEKTFTIPDNDKTATVFVRVHMGMRIIPAALDDELAKKAGFETYEKMRETAVGIATNRIQENEQREISQQIMKKLVDNHNFETPSWLNLMEAQQMCAQNKKKWEEISDTEKEMFITRAKDNVKISLILDQVQFECVECQFADHEIINVIKQQVLNNGQDPDKFLQEAQKDGSLVGIISNLRAQATIQWLISQIIIIE